MSDCAINIRILYWYFQLTIYKKWRIGCNYWLWENQRFKSLLFPIAVYQFDLSRLGTDNEPEYKKVE